MGKVSIREGGLLKPILCFIFQIKNLKQTDRCVEFESCVFLFVNGNASDKFEPVLDDDGCSDEPAGVYRVSLKYKSDQILKLRMEDNG